MGLEPRPNGGLERAHGIGGGGEAELGVAGDGIPGGEADGVEGIGGVDADVEAEFLCGAEGAAEGGGEGELGAFLSTGSAPGSGFVGRLTVIAERGRWRVATSGRIDYQKTFNEVTRNQIRVTVEPNYKFDEHGYVFGLGQYERDRFQGFTDRYSLSAGLGYNLLDADGRKLSIKAGPAMRLTQPVDGPQEQTLSAAALADLKLRLTPTLSYSQEVSTYFDAVRRTYYTLAALDSRLSSKLKARLSYMLQHEAGSGVARTLTDTTSRLTLIYGF